MSPNWYYKHGDKQIGPVDQATFQEWIGQGQISPEQLVRREDWTDWRPVNSLDPLLLTPLPQGPPQGPGPFRPAPPGAHLPSDAIPGPTLKVLGIACAVGAAICAFTAIERYATNAANVSAINGLTGASAEPAIPTITLYALFIGAVLAACGVACFVTLSRRRQAVSQAPASPPESDMFMIDYGHEAGGVFHHGTFSLVGGKVAAAWTEDDGDKKKRREVPMTEDAFKGIWDSLTEIADFQAGAVKDAHQPLDPRTNHVVELIFNMGGRKETRTYMVPAQAASPAFKAWLAKLV